MNKKELLKEIGSYIKITVVAAAAVFLINQTLIVNATVPTGSMENTVMTGSRIVINRLSYISDAPKRGDIISFYLPDDGKTRYLKRIIGESGEVIEGIGGRIYIDGEELEESYIRERSYDDFGPYQIPEDSYFVMGDNRNHSWDSRYWTNKFVNKDAIIGRAEIEYYPEIKRLNQK